MSKYAVFSGPYFPAFWLDTERYPHSDWIRSDTRILTGYGEIRIQSECGKIRTRKNSIFGHFLRSQRGDSNIDFRRQYVIMTQTRQSLIPWYMLYSQVFNKINSFLKPVLDIFIFRNFIVGWGMWLLRKELVFYIKSIDLTH